MTKRKPMCLIKGCNHRAKRKVRIDIGPTVGDAVVAPEARIQTIGVCQGHLDLISGARDEHLHGLIQKEMSVGFDASPNSEEKSR